MRIEAVTVISGRSSWGLRLGEMVMEKQSLALDTRQVPLSGSKTERFTCTLPLCKSKSQLLMMIQRHVGDILAGARECAPIDDCVPTMITSMAQCRHKRWLSNSLI